MSASWWRQMAINKYDLFILQFDLKYLTKWSDGVCAFKLHTAANHSSTSIRTHNAHIFLYARASALDKLYIFENVRVSCENSEHYMIEMGELLHNLDRERSLCFKRSEVCLFIEFLFRNKLMRNAEFEMNRDISWIHTADDSTFPHDSNKNYKHLTYDSQSIVECTQQIFFISFARIGIYFRHLWAGFV